MDYIIKKRLERDRFFNQEITEEYRNFDIEFYKIVKEEFWTLPILDGDWEFSGWDEGEINKFDFL